MLLANARKCRVKEGVCEIPRSEVVSAGGGGGRRHSRCQLGPSLNKRLPVKWVLSECPSRSDNDDYEYADKKEMSPCWNLRSLVIVISLVEMSDRVFPVRLRNRLSC